MKLVAIFLGTMISIAQVGAGSPMQMPPSNTNRAFQSIEQPWPIKVGVVLGGLMLVGTELWWFLGRKQQKQQL
jgi:plastocyanin domain-containing protein